ncbi:MAG: ABC transporter permease [Candidatus Azambacteria bacterium]|nr:ABC transporter permease [Candidatus Azambacteria bacterium]
MTMKFMLIPDLFQESFLALSGNKVRSSLTILGIVIGIASVIAMVSIGQGAQGTIEANIQSIGSNLLLVMPGAQRGFGAAASSGRGSAQSLTTADATAIKQEITAAKAVAPESSRRYQITAKGTNTNTNVIGTIASYTDVRNVKIDLGNFITDQNNLSSSKVAVLGPTTRDDLFGAGVNPVGQAIKINKVEFKIIGVTAAKGGSGFSNQDDVIYVPLLTAQRYLTGGDSVTTISVQANTASEMTTIQAEVNNLLLARHKISDPTLADFSIMNQADIAAAASSVTGIFTLLLASIAGISLVVGGIGIMNMMLTTVTERTKEIGLRKSIGASRQDISGQFLTEAVMLTFLGGIFGILLGWLVSLAITKFSGMATTVSLSSILLAFGVSAAIGLIFGYYPARRASKLNPIEALRFE